MRSPLVVALAAMLASSAGAAAQEYPSRPITMVVGFAAGGAADSVARIVAEGMRVPLGQSVVIENVSGAGGSIGVGRAARAAPDGYTVSFGSWGTHVVNGALYQLQYDLLNDLDPVALVASQPMLIIAKKDIPADNLKELIAWLKANPGKASVASAGVNSASHIAAIFFEKESGTEMQHVPYRGGAPAIQDIVSGRVEMMIAPVAEMLPPVQQGLVKGMAITAKERLKAAPDIPSVDEAGLPGIHIVNWNGLWVPAKTPRAIVDRLNAAVVDALVDPNVRARLAQIGQEIPPRAEQTPEALGALQKAEAERWWPILKAMAKQEK
jgi:tripartite-type tricarboxylate transporter receptor subunit TctC